MFQWNLRTFPPFRDPPSEYATQFMQFDAQRKKRAASADYAWTIETGGDSVLQRQHPRVGVVRRARQRLRERRQPRRQPLDAPRCEWLRLAFPPNSHEEERAQRGAQ